MAKFTTKTDWLLPIAIGLIIGLFTILITSDANTFKREPTKPQGYAQAIEKVLPFNVSIFSQRSQTDLQQALIDDPYFAKFLQQNDSQSSLGSGIIINTSGTVVTNAHVIEHAESIIIMTHDGTLAQVTQTVIDPETDIAILKTNLTVTHNVPVATIEDTRIGDIVFSIGNPFGVGQSVSMGIVSAVSRNQPGLTTLTDFIQTDAAINPGNSGGALVNTNGDVIGMNTAIFSSSGGSQGIGFAIPFSVVFGISNELEQHGSISRGYLGIDVVETPPTTSNNSDKLKVGLVIISVAVNSPADIAGILAGDLLLEVNQMPVSSRIQAARLISQLMPDKKLQLKVERAGTILKLQATLTRRN